MSNGKLTNTFCPMVMPFSMASIIKFALSKAIFNADFLLMFVGKKAITASPEYFSTYPPLLIIIFDISYEKALMIVTIDRSGRLILILVEPTKSAYIITNGTLVLTKSSKNF